MNDFILSTNHLPAIGFLAGLPDEHRAFLSCYGRYCRPQMGEVFISENEPQDSLYVILEGKLHIVTGTATGQSHFLAALGPGDSMGEINLFDPAVASASAVPRSNCLIWALSRKELESFLESDTVIGMSFLRALLGQMSKRLRSMNDKLAITEKKTMLHDFWSSIPH